MKIFLGSRISAKGSFAMNSGNKEESPDGRADYAAIPESGDIQVLRRSAGSDEWEG
jgi:hypothetical protein